MGRRLVIVGCSIVRSAADREEAGAGVQRNPQRATAGSIDDRTEKGHPDRCGVAAAGPTAGTAEAVARTLAAGTNVPPGGVAALPPGFGAGFGGTLLTGEIINDYLVLHRIRASDPVTHEIFHEGRKVGSVTEVGPS